MIDITKKRSFHKMKNVQVTTHSSHITAQRKSRHGILISSQLSLVLPTSWAPPWEAANGHDCGLWSTNQNVTYQLLSTATALKSPGAGQNSRLEGKRFVKSLLPLIVACSNVIGIGKVYTFQWGERDAEIQSNMNNPHCMILNFILDPTQIYLDWRIGKLLN